MEILLKNEISKMVFISFFVYDLIRKWVTGNETAIYKKGKWESKREAEGGRQREHAVKLFSNF